MNFYRTFIRLCNENGKTPSRVALDVGVSKPAVSRWKQGSIPSDITIQKLADYFHVDFEYLKYGPSRTSPYKHQPGDEIVYAPGVEPTSLFSGIGGFGSAAGIAKMEAAMKELATKELKEQEDIKPAPVQTPEAMREAVVRFWAESATDDMIRDFFYIAFGAHGSDIQAQLKELAVLDHVPLDYRVSVVKNIITFYNLAQARGELVCEDLAPANLHVLVEAIRAGLNAVGEGRDSYIQAGE